MMLLQEAAQSAPDTHSLTGPVIASGATAVGITGIVLKMFFTNFMERFEAMDKKLNKHGESLALIKGKLGIKEEE